MADRVFNLTPRIKGARNKLLFARKFLETVDKEIINVALSRVKKEE